MQETKAPEQRIFFIRLQTKLLVGFTLLFSVVFAVAFLWFYRFATDMALGRIQEDLVSTIIPAAEGIDGDQLRALYTEEVPAREDGYTDDPRYWEQVKWLATVHKIEPRAWLYTYILGDLPGELIFITSNAALEEPPWGATFLEHWVTDNPGPNISGLKETTLQETLPGETSDGCYYQDPGCKLVPYGDDFGKWVSAFTPIKNSEGEVVAALGIDFEADYVSQVQQAIQDRVVIAFAITYAVLFLLVYLVSRILTRPFITLTGTADKIGEADYEGGLTQLERINTDTRTPDEIVTLARVFKVMIDKVYHREQTLKRQVEELRIEIDEVKRQKQVGEIVDTDFFRDLQDKADQLRARRRASGTEG